MCRGAGDMGAERLRSMQVRKAWSPLEFCRDLLTRRTLVAMAVGWDVGVKNGKIVGVRGRHVDTVNKGRLGPKGLHGLGVSLSGMRAHSFLTYADGVRMLTRIA